ncbi:AraC family transcriptional regulator [Hymenobacter arizonensis]|uniref:AraC-type DNA-binding protein n=1 Tax=Hymenobacter arizonensis TaxID=1227077 RepID=A0A1I6BHM9_HYMAR|nr:helix-turn-helix domain-containing protein [Hymenobacter arizonensis]SFQ80401.1 AraC-type DNA-binding protein [Hymenobacter arizonensis]
MSFIYREQYATAPLTDVVRKVWVMDNARNPQPFSSKTVLPNGCFNLALVTGAGLDVRNRRGPLAMSEGIYFCGQARLSVDTTIRPFTSVTMVQLHPWGPARLTTASFADTADAIVPLAAVLPALHELLTTCLGQPETAVLAFLQTHLPPLIATDLPLLRQACLRWQHTNGTLAVLELAQEVGCSIRSLEKQFRHALGLTPKAFATVLRVRGVVDALQRPHASPLAQLALEYGFYDQAHFINAFRKMVQRTPGQFVPAEYMLPLMGTGY